MEGKVLSDGSAECVQFAISAEVQNPAIRCNSGVESVAGLQRGEEYLLDPTSDRCDEEKVWLKKQVQELQTKLTSLQTHTSVLEATQVELTDSLRIVIADRDKLRKNMSASNKERDYYGLRCQELEQRLGILEAAEKARTDLKPLKETKESNEDLKKLGLSTDVLLHLPFGVTSKIRSAFEKLYYENERLKDATPCEVPKGCQLKISSQETLEKFNLLTKQKEKLVSRLETMSSEVKEAVNKLEETRKEAQLHKETSHALRELLVLLGKEVEQLREDKQQATLLVETLKSSMNYSSPGFSSTSLSSSSGMPISNSELQHGLPYDVLKLKCNLLSRINTSTLIGGNFRSVETACALVEANYPSDLHYQHWSQKCNQV